MTAQVTQLRPPLPVKAGVVGLTAQMSTAEAFRLTVQECLAHSLGNVPSVRAGQSEGVHQLRVGLRRLNSALVSFGAPFRGKRVKSLRRRTKSLAGLFGPARDFDVFISDCLQPVAATAHGGEALTALTRRAEAARAKAWDTALRAFDTATLQTFVDEATAVSAAKRWDRVAPIPICETATQSLDENLARAVKRSGHLDRGEDDDFHRLRLALKKLRYTAEFFESLYDSAHAHAYLARLKTLQDVLGEMNDAAAARHMLQRLAAEDPENGQALAQLSEASALVSGWHAARRPHLTAKALRKWERLRGEPPFWH